MRVQFPVTILMKYMYIGADQTAGKRNNYFNLHWSWLLDKRNLCESEIEKFVINLLFIVTPIVGSVIVLCFVVRYFMSILVLQSSWWGRESWLLCLICLPGVSWWLSGSSSRCHGVVCSLWLWYFLIILTYYFWNQAKKIDHFCHVICKKI